MHKKMILSVCAAAGLVFGAPAAAVAVDTSTSTTDAPDDAGSYTPDKPDEPSLAGSSVAAYCLDNAPWIDFSVELTDPDDIATSHVARLVFSNGTNTTTVTLGTLVDGALSGSVLWPGAAVDGSTATAWPGWEYFGGAWHETGGNFGWTKGDDVTATIEVNPVLVLPVSYPNATSACEPVVGEVAGGSVQSAGLAATGGDIVTAAGVGIAAIALVGTGAALVVRRRKA